jgi:MoaA/NifB/PqqE/SkfB family radical SAM enzyme
MRNTLDNLKFVLQPMRKPLLLGRIARSYLRFLSNKSPQERPIRNVDIALNYACNLSCEHCSCELLKKKEPMLTASQYKDIAGQALDMGCIYFAFTGGEPLLNKDLEDIIQIFHPDSTLIGLQTNAMLLTPQRAKSLRKAGADALQISFDSANPDEHDTLRQQGGAFKAMMSNVDTALKLGFKIIFSSTITHSNLRGQGVLDMFHFTHERGIPLVLSVPCAVGKWSNNFSEQLDDNDREYFDQLRRRFPHLRRDFDSNYAKRGCSAGSEKLYITPYGDVIPCPFVHISFGNVTQEPLKAIRKRMISLDRFREYNQVCLAGEDKDFIDRFIIPTYGKSLPVQWNEHQSLKKLLCPESSREA